MTDWSSLPWTEIEARVAEHRIALLPLGAIEEHGPHLALGADWHASIEFGRRVAEAAGCLCLPAIPYGQVFSLAEYPGTLGVSNETLSALITDLGGGLRRAGVGGLVLLSCHLGNLAAMKDAARRLGEADLPTLYLFYPGLREIAGRLRSTPEVSSEIVHADEIETSIFLDLIPDDVDMAKAVAESPELPKDLLASSDRWREFSASGVFGDPTVATPELGRALVEAVQARAVELIQGWRARLEL